MKTVQSIAKGFTLIELMIVMSIVALLMGVVGPFAINNLEKVESKSELLTFKNWMREVSHKSYISNQSLTLELEGKILKLYKSYSGVIIKEKTLSYLFFEPQKLTFNSKGFVSPTVVKALHRGKEHSVRLDKWINRESDIEITLE